MKSNFKMYAQKANAMDNEAALVFCDYVMPEMNDLVENKDFSKNRALEVKLAEEKIFHQTIVRTAQVLIIVLDSDGRVLVFNEKCRIVTGYSPNEVLGKKIWDVLLSEPDSETLQEMFSDLERNFRTNFENTLLTKNGESRTIVWNSTLIKKPTNTFQIIITGEDVTERRALEAQLRHVQKMEAVGTLAGGIAHDFNNMLTGILGNISLAKMLSPEESEIHQLLHQAEEASERAGELTKQLLGFSRKQRPNFGPADVNKTVGKIVSLIHRSIPENIEIETEFDKLIPTIKADSSQLEQVLLNMAINARDAMPEGGHIIFRTKIVEINEKFIKKYSYARCGFFVRLSIIDTGTGMDKQIQSRVFEPFFTTKKDKGTGLGLAMCYGLIKNHEGWINLHSDAGIGTTFEIYLPMLKAKEEGRHCEVLRLCDMPRGSETILLADDTETVLFSCRHMLECLGYKALVARDGHEAYDIYEQNRDKVSLVVTDLVMPRCGGRKLLKRLRSNGHQVPVILASGYAVINNSVAETEEEGFSGFVPKPFTLVSLASVVRSVLDAHTSKSRKETVHDGTYR